MARAARDKPGSTNSAISDASQNVFHLASTGLGIDCSEGRNAAEGAIGMPQPASGTVAIAQVLIRDCNNARQAVEPVGLVARQPSTTAPALQAARREIECAGKFLERQTGRLHQLFYNAGTKALADGVAKIAVAGKSTSQSSFSTQLPDHGPDFIYHYVAYCSDNCRMPSNRIYVGFHSLALAMRNYLASRSPAMKKRNAIETRPFMVKKAAFTRLRSSCFTSECS